MEVLIEGHRELIRSLRRIDTELVRELAGIHKQIAEPIAVAAAARAPRRSGALADSIRAQGTQRVARVAAGRKAVPYAGPIHYGWPSRNIRANPFLQDALETQAERIADDYLRLLDRFIDSVWETIR